jgi:AraC-like DNA-binding protein
LTEFSIRPGCLLAWGPDLALQEVSPDAQALFAFIIAGEPNRDADRMALKHPHPDARSACPCTAAAFSAVIALSGVALDELILDDDSAGAARIREFRASAHTNEISLPLTTGARLGVESIRRCPFAGACRAMALAARVNDLLVEFLTSLSSTPSVAAPILRRADELVRNAAGLLARDLDNPPTLAALAREVGLSETTLKRGFHQVFGTTVFGYLRGRRMERAHTLLQSGEATVLEAAARVGYSNPSNFAAAFRRQFGINPKEFQIAVRR